MRPDLMGLTVGQYYFHNATNAVVRYLGTAPMTELAGEDVGVFRLMPSGPMLVATQHSYNHGETFQTLGDNVDFGDEPEWDND